MHLDLVGDRQQRKSRFIKNGDERADHSHTHKQKKTVFFISNVMYKYLVLAMFLWGCIFSSCDVS